MTITHASHLTDTELLAALTRLAHGEREATVAPIVHLAEFDARRLYEGAGFSSMFAYCLSVLRVSEDAIYNRIHAARAARRFPEIVDMLAEGALSPTTVRLLARHLTAENHEEFLAAASGKGKQAVEELLARRFPQPDVRSSVRKVASREVRPAADRACADVGAAGRPEVVVGADPLRSEPRAASTPAAAPGVEASLAAPLAPVAPRAVVRPLAHERYEIRFTASAEMREKLRLAQDLLGHAMPSGDVAAVFDRALTLLVADLTRKKFAATPQPRGSRGQAEDSRNVPAEVKRAVAARDSCRCGFVAPNGRWCGERRFLEFHHVVPYAAGGRPTVENIQLRCRAHNAHEAELFFGPVKQWVGGAEVRESRVSYDCAGDRTTRDGTSSLAVTPTTIGPSSSPT